MKIQFKFDTCEIRIESSKKQSYLFEIENDDTLDIHLSELNIKELIKLLEERPAGIHKIGKTKGFFKNYIKYRRTTSVSPVYLELNSWLTIFGASLGVTLERENADDFCHLLSTQF
jgi:hypothetical protein